MAESSAPRPSLGRRIDTLAVIEWTEGDIADWINIANPVQLLEGEIVEPSDDDEFETPGAPLPNGVEGILEHVTTMAAGYSTASNGTR